MCKCDHGMLWTHSCAKCGIQVCEGGSCPGRPRRDRPGQQGLNWHWVCRCQPAARGAHLPAAPWASIIQGGASSSLKAAGAGSSYMACGGQAGVSVPRTAVETVGFARAPTPGEACLLPPARPSCWAGSTARPLPRLGLWSGRPGWGWAAAGPSGVSPGYSFPRGPEGSCRPSPGSCLCLTGGAGPAPQDLRPRAQRKGAHLPTATPRPLSTAPDGPPAGT